MEKKKQRNRLAEEKSPYLLQHAENPINWYPWCEEAFAQARARNVPVFLSIGYSTCHWCHAMAHESFEDEQIGKILNDSFVAIKVDREERPDIDTVYMSVCQAMTGSGGWPLTILMTPDKEAFFAATYLPKQSRLGTTGLMELLTAVAEKWSSNPQMFVEQGHKITTFLKDREEENRGSIMSQEGFVREGLALFASRFDSAYGGFGRAPKFPAPHNLLFLLASGEEAGKAMALKTLQQMYRGGIFDHIGGGFCRYSTDEFWLVPHFEKMLYDNALLVMAYCEAFRETGDDFYRHVAKRTMDYMQRELWSSEGGFFCGQDADSDGEEGKYYVFTPEEIRRVLGREAGKAFCRRYDIHERGNFEKKSIPNLLTDPDFQKMPEEYTCLKLYHYRKGRTTLHKDDKILTAWNGLAIAAFARAAGILNQPDLFKPAEAAAAFIWTHLRTTKGRLRGRYRDGQADFNGILDDYAFYCWGLLECYHTTLDADYLIKAESIGKVILEEFFDKEKGGCYFYGDHSEQLIIRPKEVYDGAMPSGNTVAVRIFDRLSVLTGKAHWRSAYEKQLDFLLSHAQNPMGSGFFLWFLSEKPHNR